MQAGQFRPTRRSAGLDRQKATARSKAASSAMRRRAAAAAPIGTEEDEQKPEAAIVARAVEGGDATDSEFIRVEPLAV